MRYSLHSIPVLLALLATGCSPSPQSDNVAEAADEAPEQTGPDNYADIVAVGATAPQGTLAVHPFGTVKRDSLWRKAGWTPASPKPINVCWENPTPADQQYRDAVRDAVRATWQRVSMLQFDGWGTCTGSRAADEIRIHIADAGPHVKALGRYLDDYPQGMVLNFTFANWSPKCQQDRVFCAKAVGVHEFGHALGFAHEQNRPDAPVECRGERQGTDGDWNVTAYDPKSIMNYCNKDWNNNGLLSDRDVEAVTTIYGRRA